MSTIHASKHPILTSFVARGLELRRIALCLPLLAVGLSPLACDVETAELDAADEEFDSESSEDEGSSAESSESGSEGPAEPELEEPCYEPECAPLRNPELDLTAEPDPSAGTACGGPTSHLHGFDLFPASYEAVLGCDCTPGQNRDYFTWWNAGNGSCSPIGWLSPDPQDCRVRMQINRSGGFASGRCYVAVEESAAGSCYAAQTNTGCNDPGITNCVCNQDSYCCTTQWDALCAWEVTSLGCG